MEMINIIGRRKVVVVCVYLIQGVGNVIVNGKDLVVYFLQLYIQLKVVVFFNIVEIDSKIYDFKINVDGGGYKG